jgi:hypothetical protein
MSRRHLAAALGAVALAFGAPQAVHAQALDWEVRESADPPLPVAALRNVRDGFLTFGDAWLEANTAFFGVFCLAASQLSMGFSDAVGLLDDNPVTQHVFKGLLSKSVAKTAYLWHVAGSETLLGGHGMEVERWATRDVADLNPLLSDADKQELAGPLPLPALDFVGEGLFHSRAYRPHVLALDLGAIAAADVALRPAAGVLRILQLRRAGDSLERTGNDLVRRAVRTW